ncbi:DNA polymerase III epsilon subunit [Brevundimonas diminuta 3F5N]|uniref:DNA polymerase III epsilon subunit n=1 Tax=Brevundimonas diminuta 3F5N TaxID=1255603 RepID=A0A1R4G3Q9_BREDI|nr:DNA polymerase III epsilon subunit [Brevundimonas diminuta 3F5N]
MRKEWGVGVNTLSLEAMAEQLEQSGEYRVLRKLSPGLVVEASDGGPVRRGLYVDVETTGLDPEKDEIIELAMVPFTYGSDGRITEVGEAFEGLRQPAEPIPAHITAITGIDDTMVAGRSIDSEEVARFAGQADLIIAHNAAFDRRFLERFCPVFVTKPWACSMTQIDWGDEGHEGVKLAYLAMGVGFFYDGHRAVHDCAAGIALLASKLPRSGERALARLLERARAPTWRIWAEGAPFDLKDVLKARGYRWNAEGLGGPKAWFTDVSEADKAEELDFLARDIGLGDREPLVRRVSAYDRFSERC